jgi:hypothetical protein
MSSVAAPAPEPRDLFFGMTASGNDQGPDRSHYPYARKLRLGWRRDVKGQWTSDAEDPEQWEVLCGQCGDTDGPAAGQTPAVRTLRGPYATRHKARHAVARHFKKWATPNRWVAGSTFPEKM